MADELTPEEATALKAQVDEFRDTNRRLIREQNEATEAQKAMQEQIDKLTAAAEDATKGKQSADEEKTTLAQRIENLESANRAKDEALEAERAKGRETSKRDALAKAFIDRNGNDAKAAADAADLAMRDWQIDAEGNLKPTGQEFDAEGNKITLNKYAEGFLLERPHFAGKSTGDGRGKTGDGFTADGKEIVDPKDPVAMGLAHMKINSGDAVYAETE